MINADSKVKEIMDNAEEDAVIVKEEEWYKLPGHLKSILLQKCNSAPSFSPLAGSAHNQCLAGVIIFCSTPPV